MQAKPGCGEQAELLERYHAAVQMYKEAMASLSDASQEDFGEIYERAEGVRLIFKQARFELREHIRKHGC
jgi:hypothetical protein